MQQMKRSGWSILLLTGLLLALTACSSTLDSGDMKDVELVTALAADQAATATPAAANGQAPAALPIEATVQLLNRDKALERQYTESYYNLSAQGENLAAAVGELYRFGARQLNFSHTSLLLLGEAAADSDFWLDYALRSPEIRPTVYPVVCGASRGSELLEVAPQVQSTSPAYLLNNILEPLGSGRPGAAAISLQEFVDNLLQPGITPVLPLVELQEQGPELTGLALYDDNGQMKAYLRGDAALGWLWLVRSQYLQGHTLAIGDGVVLQVVKAELTADWQERDLLLDKLLLSYQLELRAQILTNPAALDTATLARLTEERLQQLLQAALAESRYWQLDFLGIGRQLYRQQPQIWAQMAGQGYLNMLTVDLTVAAEILEH